MQDTSFDLGRKSGEKILLLSPAGIEKNTAPVAIPGAVDL
jgi:hypothetical protein